MRKILHYLERTALACLFILITSTTYSQTATPPSVGDGSESNPYEIATLENLYWLSQNSTEWDKHYIQTANIDATSTAGWDSGAGCTPIGNFSSKFTGSYNGKGHTINKPFINRPSTNYIGFFGYTSNAQIDSLGLTNIDITGNSYVGGFTAWAEGGTISYCYTTGNCASGSGSWILTGGLVGRSRSIISFCFSTVDVSSSGHVVGGLVGDNSDSNSGGKIINSYATGSVHGNEWVGGLVGLNMSEIKNCYSRGLVSGTRYLGGLIGYKYTSTPGTVSACFWNKETSGQESSVGGIGLTTEEMTSASRYLNYGWDFIGETTNGSNDIWSHNYSENDGYPSLTMEGKATTCAPLDQASNIEIIDVKTTNITLNRFNAARYDGATGYVIYINSEDTWDVPSDGVEPIANTVWQDAGQQCIYFGTSNNPNITVTSLNFNTNYYFKVFAYNDCNGIETYENVGCLINQFTQVLSTFPTGEGSESNPFQIASLENLAWLMYNDSEWDKHFIQIADINAANTIEWEDSAGFNPIGNSDVIFSGTYSGKGNIIDGLYINRPTSNYIGLFGYTDNSSKIDSLGMTNIDFTGYSYIGGLAGRNKGLIDYCYSTGNTYVGSNSYSYMGGLIGYNENAVTNCYSFANVNTSSGNRVGGLVGSNRGSDAIISNCYSIGTVISTAYSVGGLVGINYEGLVKNSFWNTETSGLEKSAGGIGLTTVEMKDFKNYLDSEWDFMDETYNGTNDYWGMNGSVNSGYPFLNWQGYTNTEILSCQMPLSAANDIFSDVFSNTVSIDSLANSGYGTVGFAIYVNSAETWVIPSDGDEPIVNAAWQNAGQQCVYFGTSNKPNVDITGLSADTPYFLKVYAYNDCSGTETYEQTGLGIELRTKVNFAIPNGEGTVENPYIIATLENLAWVMYNDTAWNKHFMQTANIDATETNTWEDAAGFNPIGNESINFGGVYNGKGYTISNLYINRPSEEHIGLFGLTNLGSYIDSLGVTNVNITGKLLVGGLIGYNYGNIENCYSTGVVKSNISNEYVYCGGFAGYNKGTINKCYSTANVSAPGGYAVGGLVGLCRYSSSVVSNSYSLGNVIGNSMLGGLVGYLYENSSINNSYSKGNTTASEHYAAGLVGYAASGTSVSKCYSTGTSSATLGYRGGLIGDKSSTATISQSFWDTQLSGTTTSDGGVGLTTIEMKNAINYLNAGWDFMVETENGEVDNWGINTTDNGGYPFLKWQGFTCDVICQAASEPVSEALITKTSPTSVLLESFTTNAYGIKGYVVYLNTEDTWTIPSDGENPTSNSTWLNSGQQCVFNGTSNTPNEVINGLDLCSGSTTYYFKIFTYNLCDASKIYETTGLLETLETGDADAPVPDITELPNITTQCSISITNAPTATDVCAGSITGTTINPLEYNVQGTYTITWTYDDENGNTSSQEQTVIVEDNIAPIFDNITLSEVTGKCSATVTEIPTATDNCSGAVTGTTNDPLTYDEQGTYTVTWTFEDELGNISNQEQMVIVNDNVSPLPDLTNLEDIVGQCSASVSEIPTATDNCSGDIIGTTSNPLSYTEQGTYTVIWTFEDEHGNVSNQEQSVVVNDDIDPVISCIANQTKIITSDETEYVVSGNEFDPTTLSDNCKIVSITNNINDADTLNGEEFAVGTTNVIWTVEDVNGNITNCSFEVIVNKSTGIYGLEKIGVSIYPNPVNEILNISCNEQNVDRITIFDITGRKIIDKTDISKIEHVDMSGFNEGIYFVSIYNNKNIYTSKIVKR